MLGVHLESEVRPAGADARYGGGPRTHERVEDGLTGEGAVLDEGLDDVEGLDRGVVPLPLVGGVQRRDVPLALGLVCAVEGDPLGAPVDDVLGVGQVLVGA